MDLKLELVVVPVSDVDRAVDFYAEKAGFNLDGDHRAGESFRVVQLTPPGSACSITIGNGVTDAPPGSVQGMQMVVDDIEAAHAELAGRGVAPGTYQGLHLVVEDIEKTIAELSEKGVEIGEPFHFGEAGQTPGLDPNRADYGTFATFSDPDGNGWLLQEVRQRAPAS